MSGDPGACACRGSGVCPDLPLFLPPSYSMEIFPAPSSVQFVFEGMRWGLSPMYFTVHSTLYTDVCHCSALLLQGRRAQNSGEGAGTQEFFSGVM